MNVVRRVGIYRLSIETLTGGDEGPPEPGPDSNTQREPPVDRNLTNQGSRPRRSASASDIAPELRVGCRLPASIQTTLEDVLRPFVER
jgi:hypothetical protein